MSWFGQKNYTTQKVGNGPYTIAEIGCFITSFCNLLEKFGTTIDPPTINSDFIERGVYLADPEDGVGVKDDVGWNSITAVNGQVKVVKINETGGWPDTTNAIVKFAYKSPTTGQPTTHFCLVADPNAKTIVDSWDGVIRSPGYYGTPVAYATYDNVAPQPVIVPAPALPAPPVPVPASTANGAIVKLTPGSTITSIALRYGFTAQELLEHNDLTWAQARDLPVGYSVHLPIANVPTPVTSGYKIELLSPAQVMHVTRASGAMKWGFGNVKDWSDFVQNGLTAQNTNIPIAAVATVIVGNETAAYYMTPTNVGDYATNGQVASTIGYNWSDLGNGPYVAPTPENTTAPSGPLTTTDAITPTPVIPAPATVADDVMVNAYKASYKAYAAPKVFVVDTKDGSDLICPDCDNKRPDHDLPNKTRVSIAGTFIKGQTLYGRPTGSVAPGLWFGVPMDSIVSIDDYYDKSTASKATNLSWFTSAVSLLNVFNKTKVK